MSDHKHGEMDISAQEATFAGFINVLVKSTIFIIAAVIVLALVGA